MTDIPKPASVAEIMAATGLGRNQVYRLIREGRIPGAVIGRKPVVVRGQFDELMSHGLRPEPITTDHQQPTFLKRRAS